MNLTLFKKRAAFFLPLLIILLVGGFVFLILKNSRQKTLSPLPATASPLPSPQEKFNLSSWEDPAGFSFQYPEVIKINPHEEDQTNYAHLELTRTGKKGRILIMVNDAKFATIEEWLSKDPEVKTGSSLDTEIEQMKAKKVALGEGKEITAFIDLDQVIYKIIKEPEAEDFWRQAYTIILESFKLTPLEGESEADFENWLEGFETSSVDVVEPVEVVE